ncbi:MAG: helix-turn-helix transcriptional regulator [Oryzomonas sp.]|uniref:helix-turn-helix domain-containing protein n=1 Tax=Oryzomonas sp. TaxID=2855186 RepID=UPI00284782BA|nr:helix-turn-helix transcriptional regulator [Oryzomonas sp.]MDR3581151.1 helix-turn-helix transcriptional regulator [Oryzomonas sp.]
MDIGENIRSCRKKWGYTQKQLAVIIGVKATYISALERGLRRPGKKILPLLCDALGVDERTLFWGRFMTPYLMLDQDEHPLVAATKNFTYEQILKVLSFINKMKASGK